ncbi:MAG: hypothetical protein RID91_13415 [Azospirillaceae bacterium]
MPSQALSVLHDSAGLLISLDRPDFLFHPNHLLFQPILSLATEPFATPGESLSRLPAFRFYAALAGAGTLALGYLWLTTRLAVPARIAGLAVAGAALSFGIWFYSISVEIYIFPLFLMTAAVVVVSDPAAGRRRVALAAGLHALAVLFHQFAILLAPAILVLLLDPRRGDRGDRIAALGLYAGIGAAIVGGAYAAVIALSPGLGDPAAVRAWILGYAGESRFWESDVRISALAPLVGWARAVIGGHFAFVLPGVTEAAERLTTHSDVTDDRFLVRGMAPAMAYGLTILTLAWGVLAAAIGVPALVAGLRRRRRAMAVAAAWLLPFAAFFAIYESHNRDFWIVQTFVAWMILAIGVAARPPRRAVAGLGALVLGLALINGLGSVLPARSPANDYYRQMAERLTADLGPGDAVVLAHHWPWRHHVALATEARILTLDRFDGPDGAPALTERLPPAGSDARVRLWPGVLAGETGTSRVAAGRPALLDVLIRPDCVVRNGPAFAGRRAATLVCVEPVGDGARAG